MSALANKLRRAREVRIPCGHFTLIAQRPTPLEHEERIRNGNPARGILSLVSGWEGVTEADLLPNGDPHPLPFDAEACAEWLADRPDLFARVAEALVESFKRHCEELDDILGN